MVDAPTPSATLAAPTTAAPAVTAILAPSAAAPAPAVAMAPTAAVLRSEWRLEAEAERETGRDPGSVWGKEWRQCRVRVNGAECDVGYE